MALERPDRAASERRDSGTQMSDRQGYHDRAEAMFRRVLEQRPDNLDAHRGIQIIASRRQTRLFSPQTADSKPSGPSPIVSDRPGAAELIQVSAAADRSEPDAASGRPSTASVQARSRNVSPVSDQVIRPSAGRSETKGKHASTGEPNGTSATDDDADQSQSGGTAASTGAPGKNADSSEPGDSAASCSSGESPKADSDHDCSAEGAGAGAEEDGSGDVSAEQTVVDHPDVLSGEDDVPILLAVLRHCPDARRRAMAALKLGTVEGCDAEINGILSRYAQDADALVAVSCCESLLVRGQLSDQMMGSLMNLTEHPDPRIRLDVCTTLRRLAGTPREDDAIHALLLRLNDSSPPVRTMAALTLSDFQERTEVILERLVDRCSLETDAATIGTIETATQRIVVNAAATGEPLPFADDDDVADDGQ